MTLELACKITIEIYQLGPYLEATAEAPKGYSWTGSRHKLVVSWHVPSPKREDLAGIRADLGDLVREAGELVPCRQGCECGGYVY